MKRALALAAVVLATAPPGAGAQPALQLTLEEAITRGLATSHRLAEAVARGEAADAVVAERRAAMTGHPR